MSTDELLSKIRTEEQLTALLKKLPKAQQEELNASPQIKRLQVPKFLHHVARGEQNEAMSCLKQTLMDNSCYNRNHLLIIQDVLLTAPLMNTPIGLRTRTCAVC